MKIASEGQWRIEDLKDAICNALISLSESAKSENRKCSGRSDIGKKEQYHDTE